MNFNTRKIFDFTGKTIVITGGAGVLCSQMARSLHDCGAHVAILDHNMISAGLLAEDLNVKQSKNITRAIYCDVLDGGSVRKAVESVIAEFGKIDGLINGAGGNKPQASTSEDLSFFDLPQDAVKWVFDLNLVGTIIPSQIISKYMAEQKHGVILNISSMNAFRPLTRIPAYSAAKAGVSNFTQWLAVHLAQEYSPNIRVNAIAPGFFMTDQNRYLLLDAETGELSPRGKKIIDHTPMGRFGNPEDLVGTTLWLLSPAADFITGVVIPVDGGFSAYSGI
jgi:NAD(P)-dependent dehydrogenase (short-subunit alcohol dehydrogenase family)